MSNYLLPFRDLLILPGITPQGNKLLFFRMADLDPHTVGLVPLDAIYCSSLKTIF